MGSIVLLDEQTINQIAAGEVIERPANVVKEMCENSIDAGATSISVEIENGGISLIRITDNGKGIAPDDIEMAFERHATSKIRRVEDLMKISTMGFRGEALASIASISKVEVTTRTKENEIGYRALIENGEVVSKEECGAPVGTTITVNELFYNTPVRYKFLKKDFTEGGYIEDIVSKLALVHPEISFKLVNNKRVILKTSGNGDLKSVIFSVYGKDVANNIIDVDTEHEGYHIKGVVGKPEISRSNRSNQVFFVNGRNIRDKMLSTAVEKAYGTLLHEGRYAFCVLNIEMSPELVDVNVHPAKLEVRFQEESKIFSAINLAIKSALFSEDLTVKDNSENLDLTKEEHKNTYNEKGFFDYNRPAKEDYMPEEKEETKQEEPAENQEAISDDGKEEVEMKIEVSEPIDNVVTLDFKKEMSMFRDGENAIKEDSEEYIASGENDEDINMSKLDFSKKDERVDLSQFDFSEEEFNGDTSIKPDEEETIEVSESEQEEKEAYLRKEKLFRVEDNDSMGTRTDIPKVDGDDEITKLGIKAEFVGKDAQENILKKMIANSEANEKPDYQIIGVGFLTYIFVQIGNEIYIFDQHAAHERVLYERVKKNYNKEGGKDSQMLLLPDVLDLSKKDMRAVLDNIDMFKKAGFELEEFGENTIKLVGVPNICYDMDTRELFMDLIDGMDINNKTTAEEIENRFLATVACKAAVKANMKLSIEEIKTLFDELLTLENPFTCPHGRPTAIRLTKDEIEKKFKRKGF